MIYGLYLSAAGALMESARHSVIANNLANVNTSGFRDDFAVVRARAAEAVEANDRTYATLADRLGGGAILSETVTRTTPGPINVTSNPFDLAIDGEGFFAVSDGVQTLYTRAGAFTRDTGGRLATPDGRHFLADESGNPITLPLEGQVAIAKDGTIAVDGVVSGKIDLCRFSDEKALVKQGGALYADRGAGLFRGGAGQIRQGALEMSSVNPTAELVNMIAASRGYEMNMQLIRMQDQTIGDLISLGRLTL